MAFWYVFGFGGFFLLRFVAQIKDQFLSALEKKPVQHSSFII